MKFKEIINRLTGVSTPIFGVQWNPSEITVTKARRIIVYLEDRRVLYAPWQMEIPQFCVESVIEIRQFLTAELGGVDNNSELAQSLRAMRAACRKFLDTVQGGRRIIPDRGWHPNHHYNWVFHGALGELRGVFGVQVAKIAAQHGLDVEDDLASILPAEDQAQS
jgi:hypothetical protein